MGSCAGKRDGEEKGKVKNNKMRKMLGFFFNVFLASYVEYNLRKNKIVISFIPHAFLGISTKFMMIKFILSDIIPNGLTFHL